MLDAIIRAKCGNVNREDPILKGRCVYHFGANNYCGEAAMRATLAMKLRGGSMVPQCPFGGKLQYPSTDRP